MNLKDIDINLVIKLANQNQNDDWYVINITPNSNGDYFEDGKIFDNGVVVDVIIFHGDTKNGFNTKSFVKKSDYLSEIRDKKISSIL